MHYNFTEENIMALLNEYGEKTFREKKPTGKLDFLSITLGNHLYYWVTDAYKCTKTNYSFWNTRDEHTFEGKTIRNEMTLYLLKRVKEIKSIQVRDRVLKVEFKEI